MKYLLPIVLTSCALAQPIRLTLTEARSSALNNHPSLQALSLAAEASAEVPKQIRSALSPQVVAGASGSAADESSRFVFGGLTSPLLISRLGGGLQASKLLYDGGRTTLLASSSALRANAQSEAVKAARLQVLLGVDRAFFSVLRARVVLEVAKKTVDARQLAVEQVEALSRSQLRSTLDLSFAKVNLAEAQILMNRAINEEQSAQADLAAALGLKHAALFELIDEPDSELLPPDAEPLVQKAIRDRPELRQLALEIDANTKLLNAEKQLAKPTLSLQAVSGLVSPTNSGFKNRYAAIGLTVSLPLFNGRLFEYRQTELALRTRSIEKVRENSSNQIARDVRNALINARNSFDRVRLTRELLDQSILSLQLAQARYDLGLGSIVELSQAQLNQTAAEVSSASAKYEFRILRSALRYQLGEGDL